MEVLRVVLGHAEVAGQVLRVFRQPSAPPSFNLFGGLIIQLFFLLFTDILLVFHIQFYLLHFCNSNRIILLRMWVSTVPTF